MSKDILCNLIDNVDEKEYDVLYRILLKFVKEVPPTQDEVEAIKIANIEYANGDYVNANEFEW